MMTKSQNGVKVINFPDYPKFRPNLTPRQIFEFGSFGGTYWRPIHSSVTGQEHVNCHLVYPKKWWQNIPDFMLKNTTENYSIAVNKYKVKVGTSLEFWQHKNWIKKIDPRGWVQWYCSFYSGRRSHDDARQIKRWCSIAGPRGRFRRMLINMIRAKSKNPFDFTISPKIRQTLQHWGYALTRKDFEMS